MQVRIYQPSQTAMQSGHARTHIWVVVPVLTTKREPEPLMGWASANDAFSTLRGKLRFNTVEAAVSFAARNGWEYHIDPPAERKVMPRNYLDNFRIVRPEDEEREAARGA